MPFKSKAQMGWMFAHHPKMAERWAKHTPDIKSLPEKKPKYRKTHGSAPFTQDEISRGYRKVEMPNG